METAGSSSNVKRERDESPAEVLDAATNDLDLELLDPEDVSALRLMRVCLPNSGVARIFSQSNALFLYSRRKSHGKKPRWSSRNLWKHEVVIYLMVS
jgi:hypothetical protein